MGAVLEPADQEARPPNTRSTLPITEPMIEAFTTVVNPAERTKMVMITRRSSRRWC